MSASFALPEQIDGLEKLLTLASLNKDTIAAAGDEARKQLQLTQAEQGKVAQAKAYIAKYTSLAADLQAREDALALAQANHNKSVGDFSEHVKAENQRLENFSATLDARDAQITILEKQKATEIANLSTAKAEQDRAYREAMAAVESAKRAIDVAAQANAEEKARLHEWENTLKGKAQRIRAEAATI